MAVSNTGEARYDEDIIGEARRAAQRAGMSLGEWLDAVVESGAARSGQRREPVRRSAAESLAAIQSRLDALERRRAEVAPEDAERQLVRDIVRRLEDRVAAIARGARPRPYPAEEPRAATNERSATGALSAWSRRFGEHGGPVPPASSPLYELNQAIGEIAARQKTLERDFDDVLANHADRIDHRLDNVAERLERSIDEASPRSAMRDLETGMRAIAVRLERDRPAPAADLREELADLLRALDEVPARVADVIGERLADVARRLDTATRSELDNLRAEMREIAQGLEHIRAAPLTDLKTEFEELFGRLDALPGQVAQDMVPRIEDAARRADTATRSELEAIRGEMREIAREIDQASRQGFESLHSEFAKLRKRVEQPSSGDATAGLDAEGLAELGAIRDEIRGLAGQLEGQRHEDYVALRDEMQALSSRLEGGSAERLDELERHLATLAGRMERAGSEDGAEGLADIERQIARLADIVDSSGRSGPDLLALEQKIAELVEHIEASQGSAEAVATLREELSQLRHEVDDSDKTNQSTLAAVHDTLSKIVDRMGELEDEIEEVADGGTPAGRQAAPPPAPEKPRHDASEPPPEADDMVDRIEAVARSFRDAPEDPTPLAPGSGRPEPQEEVDPPPETAARADRESFIAAARRAAQAAQSEPRSDVGADDDTPAGVGGIAGFIGRHKRVLVLAGALVVLLAFALVFGRAAGERVSAVIAPAAEQIASTAEPEEAASVPEAPEETAPVIDVAEEAPDEPSPAPAAAKEAPRVIGMAAVPDTSVITGAIPDTEPRITELSDAEEANPQFPDEPQAALPALPLAADRSEPAHAQPSEGIGPARLREAAAAGDPAAQFEIGSRYSDGRGVEQDFAEAARWYQFAAAQGLAPAQYRLGSLYEKGQGVEQNPAMARMWYRRAAEQGNRTAMHNLAVLYADGPEGGPDYEQAAIWFRQASEYGLRDSQYNLAVLHARGLGVEYDLAEAYRWFAAAAEQGDREAAAKRDELAERLDEDDLAKARLALEAWRAKSVITEANTVAEPQGGWEADAAEPPTRDEQGMVREAQALLDTLGYDPGPVDGMFGTMTREAVLRFQRSTGLPETGDITPDLVEQLSREAG